MILFKMTQRFHGYDNVVTTHDTLADAVASVRLPTEWNQSGRFAQVVSRPVQIREDAWAIDAEVIDERMEDCIEVATIVRLVSA